MYLPSFEVIQSWLQVNSGWLGPTIAFMALIESLVIVGLVVPGVPIMFALGAMAGAGAMDPLPMLLWGIAGAVIGDGISFQLGYHFHQKVRYWWPFNKHPQWLRKGEDFFHNHGDLSIALGRFIGPVRPVVPVVAGMLDMSPRRFYIVNILSAIPWAPAYLMPGFLAGAAVQAHGAVPVDFFGLILTLLVIAIVMPSISLWLSNKFRLATLLVYALPVLAVMLGGFIVLECLGGLSHYNFKVAGWIERLHMPYLDESMAWLTWFGSLKLLCLPLLLWIGWSLYRSEKVAVMAFAIAFAGMEFSYWVLKWLIDSPRPSVVDHLDPFSFPSGHTTQATLILIWLGIQLSCCMAHVPRILMLSTAIMMVFLTGLSRLVLDVHWAGDVMAGLILGLFWLCVALYLQDRKSPNSRGALEAS